MRSTYTTAANDARVSQAVERNAEVLEDIREIDPDAIMSLSELAAALNKAGYKTARGKRVTKTQVHRIKTA